MEYSALNRNTSTNYSMHTIESGTQITEETMDKPLPLNPPLPNDSHVNAKALRLGILFVAANLTTLILTIIPVVFKNLPDFDLGPNRVGCLCIVIPWVVLKGFKGRNED
ncbi:hypothetical protein HDV02_001095 [Globomyces sp. JEL0801]|nr:hypothetical protein HDV02_001095 [Globomyces sp. JEL0801]